MNAEQMHRTMLLYFHPTRDHCSFLLLHSSRKNHKIFSKFPTILIKKAIFCPNQLSCQNSNVNCVRLMQKKHAISTIRFISTTTQELENWDGRELHENVIKICASCLV